MTTSNFTRVLFSYVAAIENDDSMLYLRRNLLGEYIWIKDLNDALLVYPDDVGGAAKLEDLLARAKTLRTPYFNPSDTSLISIFQSVIDFETQAELDASL